MLQADIFKEALDRLEAATKDAQTHLGDWTDDQLNWKPSPNKWSAAECLQHLVVAHDAYWPQIQAVVGSTAPRAPSDNDVKPTFIGRMLLRAVRPETTTRTRAPGRFNPARSHVPGSPLEAFERAQENLAKLIEGTADVDWHRVKVTTPVNRLIRFRLGEVYRILTAHGQRHVNQAIRLRELPGFPGGASESRAS